MGASLEERLTELEVRLSYADDAMTTLDRTVADHDRQLRALLTAFEALKRELVAVRGALAHDARDEPPPPHY